MQHLNTRQCECGHIMTVHDKTGRLEPTKQNGLYGGNVKAFADGKCPNCDKQYKLWLRQHRNSWDVVTLSTDASEVPAKAVAAENGDDLDEFDSMDRDELKAWLEGLEVEYTANWGEKRLRELCRSVVAAKEGGQE
jgi:hypothetical protein